MRNHGCNISVLSELMKVTLFSGAFVTNYSEAKEYNLSALLEEVIVTANKKEQSIQNTPIAISVVGQQQIEGQGITSLADLSDGAIPSLRVMPFGNTSSTLIMTIRGNGPTDVGQITREGSVAIYQDGIYLGRAQGLSTDITDLERMEVLRGPQGTLFGRNATGGAVSLISKKPSGQFGIEQTIGIGRYEAWKSLSRVNLPEMAGIKVKFDYLHDERDGWVENTAPGEPDFNEYEKDGGRISLNWSVSEKLDIDYWHEQSEIESTQMYFQVYNPGLVSVEPGRQTQTRFPLTLDPTVVEQSAHSLVATYSASGHLTVKSLSSYRELDEDSKNNWGGTLNSSGLIFAEEIAQEQWSQELQLIGEHGPIEWVGGLFFYKEDASEDTTFLISLDIDGSFTGTGIPFSLRQPPTVAGPTSFVDAESESRALYGQVSWSLDPLRLTVGARYSEDERSGERFGVALQEFDLDTEHLDGSFTADYVFNENLLAYFKWSTAYKVGGANLRSASFTPYEEEVAESFEVGFKSELWDRRLRFNVAVFSSDYEDMQIDVADPIQPTIVESVNASKTVQVDGVEFDLTLVPVAGLTLGLSYTYLDGDMPLQPNPLADGALQDFETTQTPKHSGSLFVDYVFSPWNIGTLTGHLNITSTDRYSYVAFAPDFQFFDSYTLINARLTLSDISVGGGNLLISAWGKNLTDEEYVVFSFPTALAYGDPRTAGIDITYKF